MARSNASSPELSRMRAVRRKTFPAMTVRMGFFAAAWRFWRNSLASLAAVARKIRVFWPSSWAKTQSTPFVRSTLIESAPNDNACRQSSSSNVLGLPIGVILERNVVVGNSFGGGIHALARGGWGRGGWFATLFHGLIPVAIPIVLPVELLPIDARWFLVVLQHPSDV